MKPSLKKLNTVLIVACSLWLILLLFVLPIEVNAAEPLDNPSFTDSAVDWTLVLDFGDSGSSVAYDGAVYQDTAGSVQADSGVGRKQDVSGTITHDAAIIVNTTDTVTLNYYRDRTATAKALTWCEIYIDVLKPSDGSSWTTIDTDTSVDDESWELQNLGDISSHFDDGGGTSYYFRIRFDMQGGNSASARGQIWFDNITLDVEPAGDTVSITNTPGNFGFGFLSASSTSATGLTYFTVTPNGGLEVDITIQASNMTGTPITWIVSNTGTAGVSTCAIYTGDGASYDTIVKNNSPFNDLVLNAPDSVGVTWGLELTAPTSITGNNFISGSITLTATDST